MEKFNPNRNDFEPYGFTCVRWTAALMPRPDRHNEVEINLLERGSLTYLMGGRKILIPARSFSVFWAGVPHRIIHFEGVEDYYVLTLPLIWFLQMELPQNIVRSILQGKVIHERKSDRFEEDRMQFERWIADFKRMDEENKQICLLELEARFRRLAMSFPKSPKGKQYHTRPSTTTGKSDLTHVERMACFIAERYKEPLTAEKIALHVDLHPNYAMRLFRNAFGLTMLDYIVQHRLSNAQRRLITTNELVLNIALNSGFGSLSRFNEAFKKAFNCTPREYRAKHRLDREIDA